ncbi:extracellular solute-binding protein [Pseudoalteromonas sp. NEC-BIFX-2020_015]|nr:extracellular solute-binding protein [Pseudoalteromonas sp. NEC-BIFX-2020_015]
MQHIASHLIYLLMASLSLSFTCALAAKTKLSNWQEADIDWRAFEGTHINVLADQQPAFMALKPYLPVFKELTGINVGFHALEQSKMRRRRSKDLEKGLGLYDVLPMGVTFLGQAYEKNYIDPIAPYINNPALTDKNWYKIDDISPNSLALCQINGTLLSLPFDFSAPIFFYRKDLFDKFELQVPNTYEELIQTKIALQKAIDLNPELAGMSAFASRTLPGAGLNTWTVLPVMRAYGAQILTQEGEALSNSREAQKGIKAYRDLVVGYGNPSNSRTLHFYDIRKLFKEGKLASAFIASHFYNEIDTPKESDIWDKWEAAPLPKGPQARETSPWAWAFAINSKSSKKSAAWLFIQWATSAQTASLLSTGGSPPRQQIWQEQLFTLVNKPGFNATMLWVFEHATPAHIQSGIAQFPAIGEIISHAYSQIFYGADIHQTLNNSNDKITVVLETNNLKQK